MPTTDRLKLAQRHEKMRELMTLRVLKEVGRAVTDSEKDFIQQEVDMMLHKGDSTEATLLSIAAHVRQLTPASSTVPTAAALKKLERHNHGAASAPQAPRSKAPTSIVSAARAADAEVARLSKAEQRPSGMSASQINAYNAFDDEGTNRRSLVSPSVLHADDLWAKMAAKDVEEYNKELLQERRLAKKREAEQRMYLEQQVALRERKLAESKQGEVKFVVEEKKQLEQWEVVERKKEEEKKRRFAEEKASRDQQLEIARQRRAAEVAKRKQEDAAAAAKDKELLELDLQQQQLRKIKAKEDVVKAQAFNREFETIRATEKAKEKARDLEHQRMYLERLRKQDEEREAAMLKMTEKQRHQQQIAFQMQSTVAEKAAEDERKAMEHKLRKEAEEIAKERERAEKAAAAKVRQRQYLMIQMIEREEQKKKERASVEEIRAALIAEQEAAERKEAERQLLQKQRALEHRKAIEGQISVSEARHRPVFMSEAEKRLNSPLLRKAGVPL